jgi:sulfatase modifying factor 1
MKAPAFSIVIVFFLLRVSDLGAAVNFQWSLVGDVGNINDTRLMNDGTSGYGGVLTNYRISTQEVTNAQYAEFLNLKDPTGANALQLYDTRMTSELFAGGIDFAAAGASGSKYSVKPGQGAKPVVFVSFYDALRFVNWLSNGQGSGSTETGAYTLLGGTPTPTNGNSVSRNSGSTLFLTSENEWYKAAYYKGGGTTAGYWTYATQTDALPLSDQAPGGISPSNSANHYFDDFNSGNGFNDGYAVTGTSTFDPNQNYLTDVGAYSGAVSHYGTFDQTGNVREWNEALISGTLRGVRGGSWDSINSGVAASVRFSEDPTVGYSTTGFRVGSVPEPTAACTLTMTCALLLRRRRLN